MLPFFDCLMYCIIAFSCFPFRMVEQHFANVLYNSTMVSLCWISLLSPCYCSYCLNTHSLSPLWTGKCWSWVWSWVGRLWWLGRGWHSWGLQHNWEEEDPWRGLSINGSCCGGSRSCTVEWRLCVPLRLISYLVFDTVQMHSRFQLKIHCISLQLMLWHWREVTIPSSFIILILRLPLLKIWVQNDLLHCWM